MDIEKKYANEFAWGDPVNYEGILIYPVKVKCLMLFTQAASVLRITPLELTDIQYKSMSRLQFLLETFRMVDDPAAPESFKYIPQLFLVLLRLVLGEGQLVSLTHPTDHRLDGKVLCITRPDFTDNTGLHKGATLVLTNKKFEIFRKIVLLQNGVDITDEDVDPIMKKVYYEDMKRLGQGKRKEIITEEDRLDLLSLNLHCFRQNLKEMSIREYLEKTDKLLARDVYLAQLNGQMTGFVKYKQPPRHWLIRQTNKEKILGHFRTEEDIRGLLNDKG